MRIKTLGITFVVLLALGGISAAAASAHTWEINGEEIFKAPRSSEASGNIKFTQETFFNSSCSIRDKGTVGVGAAGQITSITGESGEKIIKCSASTGIFCNKTFELEALNLPWNTELATVGGELRDKITGHEGVSPGWSVKCKGSIGASKFLCTAETNTGVLNDMHNGKVEAVYDGKSPRDRCSEEIGEPGLILTGTMNISAGTGLTLSAI